MDENTKYAIVLQLARSLNDKGSWCGETHVQKSMYLFEALCGIDTDLGFVLYKHGPYSFELHDIIGDMHSLSFIKDDHHPPYGPRIQVTGDGDKFIRKYYDKTFDEKIEKISNIVKDSGVQRLEKLATALLIFREDTTLSSEQRAEKLHDIKPHISLCDALAATKEMDVIHQELAGLA